MSQELPLSGLAGSTVAGYLLEKELGRGNNGVVYLARQQMLDREVALKLLLPERAAEAGFIEKFLREARNAAKLNHPNVVQALDVGKVDGVYFFAMEYVDGDSLEELRVSRPEVITPKFLLKISMQLAGALEYAWSRHNMTHGDIKPDNLLIRRSDRQLKLADLGLARISSSTASGEVMATPLYVSPEVIMQTGEPPDPRSDIYSFGIMFYELSCGVTPFDGNIDALLERHLHEKPAPLLSKNPDMDRELAQYIDSMLAKKPEQRPASWEEVGRELYRIYRKLYPDQIRATVPLDPELAHRAVPHRSAPWLWITLTLVMGLMMLGFIALLFFGRR